MFDCAGKMISIELVYGKRKHAMLEVESSGFVRLKVPEKTTNEQVSLLLDKKRVWLRKQLNHLVEQPMPASKKRYVSGESFKLYGKSLRLKVERVRLNMVNQEGFYLYLRIGKDVTREQAEQLVNSWYLKRAKKDIPLMFELEYKRCLPYIGSKKEVVMGLRKMDKRWGSCGNNGKILLNPLLVQAPKHCIRYVIVHELCHLVHFNHDMHFYALLDRLLPDWNVSKQVLDQMEF